MSVGVVGRTPTGKVRGVLDGGHDPSVQGGGKGPWVEKEPGKGSVSMSVGWDRGRGGLDLRRTTVNVYE